MSVYKILFTGPPGAGKTTAIGAVSDIAPVQTEATNTDASLLKTTTTVGMDYGEMSLADGDRLHLFGTPGQARFQVMWSALGRGALGVIVLLDWTRPDPPADLAEFLQGFESLIRQTCTVIGVGRLPANADVGRLQQTLADAGLNAPMLAVDVRTREDVVMLIEALMVQIEVRLDGAQLAESNPGITLP